MKIVRGRRYVYFWRYDRRNGRSRKIERYVGPVGSSRTSERAVAMLLEHAEMVKAEVDRRVASCKRALDRMRRR